MDPVRRSLLAGPVALSAALSLAGAASQSMAQTAAPLPPVDPARGSRPKKWPAPAMTIDLWPNGVTGALNPAMKEVVEETSKDVKIHFRRVQGITRPRLAVFPAKKPNGSAMMIIPGGGFIWNYFDHEGYQLADYLNSQGITCFVLFYRLAQDGWDKPAEVGVADAQRAMRLIKAHAAQFKLDPARVGVMGFSAGGFLTASLATRHAASLYTPVDAADQLDARPCLAAPIYAVQSVDPAIAYKDIGRVLFNNAVTPDIIATWSPDRNVDAQTPPVFLVHTEVDDAVPVANSLSLRDALKAHDIVVETHLFAKGSHGFGFSRDVTKPYHLWPELFVNFAREQGLMGTPT